MITPLRARNRHCTGLNLMPADPAARSGARDEDRTVNVMAPGTSRRAFGDCSLHTLDYWAHKSRYVSMLGTKLVAMVSFGNYTVLERSYTHECSNA